MTSTQRIASIVRLLKCQQFLIVFYGIVNLEYYVLLNNIPFIQYTYNTIKNNYRNIYYNFRL